MTWHNPEVLFPRDGSICLVKLVDCAYTKPCWMAVAVSYDRRFYMADFGSLYSVRLSEPDSVLEKTVIIPYPDGEEAPHRVVLHCLEYFDTVLAVSEYTVIGDVSERMLTI